MNESLNINHADLTHSFHIPAGDSLNNDATNPLSANTPETTAELDLKEILASIKIDPTVELNPPEVAWSQVASYGDDAIMGTLGNISLVYGKAKSRKSFFINLMVATVLTGGEFKGFKGCLPENKRRVLYFDTEQGSYHVQLAVKRICQQINNANPTDLDVYCLRKFNPAERKALIEEAIKTTPNVGFVVIDGIRDLVTSINDEEQATDITSFLMKWSEEKQIHISCVLHQNKNDMNARGHLGTELTNKCEMVLSVSVDSIDKAVSIVEADYSRGISPESFAFEVIDNLPEMADSYNFNKNTKKQKFDLSNLSDAQREDILNQVFSLGNEFTHSDLKTQIKQIVKKMYAENVGQNKLTYFIANCKNNKLIFQEKDRAPYTKNLSSKLPF